jgi:hypothetical protein
MKEAIPQFYNYSEDTFQTFSMLEMTGDLKYFYIDDFLYLYTGSATTNGKIKCSLE